MLYEGQEMEPEQVIARMNAELTQTRGSKSVLDKLAGNPKTRTKILGLMKEANPDLVIPELDSREETLSEVRAIREELAAEKKAAKEEREKAAKDAADRDTQAAIDTGRSLLRRRGFQSEGIEKVEELMKARNLPDYEAAALLFEQTQPKDSPIIPSNLGRSWDLMAASEDDADWRAAVTLPKGRGQHNALMRAQNKELNKVLQEIRIGGQ